MATPFKYGLIGYPLSHSFSPGYFLKKFKKEKIKNASYKSYPLERIEDLWEILPKNITGFNVTIPYKEQILPYLDGLDPEAKKIKAVNTVSRVNGKWIGSNTDVYGFENSLRTFIGRKKINQAMVLGNGGAAKAIKYVLRKMDIKVNVISRKRGFRGYQNLDPEFLQNNRLIINTTPVGMSPNKAQRPHLPYDFIGRKHLLFDLIYNPKKTLFLKTGQENGAAIKNGLEMLHLQAERSWEIWNSTNKNCK